MKEIGPFKDEFAFLSNFFYIPGGMIYDDIWIPTSEHAYQMMKAKYVADKQMIAKLKTPGETKEMGQKIEIRDDWEDVKVDVMREVLKAKFKVPTMGEMLKLTVGYELVEYNWWGDVFWGVSLKTKDGQNWLGRLLMEIR